MFILLPRKSDENVLSLWKYIQSGTIFFKDVLQFKNEIKNSQGKHGEHAILINSRKKFKQKRKNVIVKVIVKINCKMYTY